jgi:hypothetical protein
MKAQSESKKKKTCSNKKEWKGFLVTNQTIKETKKFALML